MKKTEANRTIYLECIDHSITGESFTLYRNDAYDMLETHPAPKPADLPRYYDSEDYISHTDGRRSWTDRMYQQVKKYTLRSKLRLINALGTSEKELLDIGCGTGDFLLTCATHGWSVTGVEPNVKARTKADEKLGTGEKLYSDLPDTSNQYDVITLWHVLEHVTDLEHYLKFLKQHLKPNGFLLVAVPNFKSYDAKHYGSYWAAYDVPRHLWHFSKNSIEKLFSEIDMQLAKSKPMLFDSFYVALLSEKYKKGKGNLFKAFFIGLLSNLSAWHSKEYSSRIYIIKHR